MKQRLTSKPYNLMLWSLLALSHITNASQNSSEILSDSTRQLEPSLTNDLTEITSSTSQYTSSENQQLSFNELIVTDTTNSILSKIQPTSYAFGDQELDSSSFQQPVGSYNSIQSFSSPVSESSVLSTLSIPVSTTISADKCMFFFLFFVFFMCPKQYNILTNPFFFFLFLTFLFFVFFSSFKFR